MTRLVAEALPRTQRLRLVTRLHAEGCTDVEIAESLTYSTFTASRIRAGLGLPPNPPRSAPQWQPGITSSPHLTGQAHR
jgi:hypothetical protein